MLRRLEYFVVLVQSGSFSRAAKRMYVSQPAISKGVKWLEASLGFPLIKRGSKTLELTMEGEICYAKAKAILDQAHGLQQSIRAEAMALSGQINIGYLTYGYLHSITGRLKRFGQKYPHIRLNTMYEEYKKAKEMLAGGTLDCFIVSGTEVCDIPGCKAAVVHKARLVAIIPKGNGLFHRQTLRIEELKEEPFVLYDAGRVPVLNQAYIQICIDSGFEPKIVDSGAKIAEIVSKTMMHNAVSLSDDTVRYIVNEEVRIVPVEGHTGCFDLCVVWHGENHSRLLERLVQALSEGDNSQLSYGEN